MARAKKAPEVRAKKEAKPARVRRWHPDARDWKVKLAEGMLGSVQDVATMLDVPAAFVYSKWRDLGGVKLGRVLRFDLARIHEHLARLSDSRGTGEADGETQ